MLSTSCMQMMSARVAAIASAVSGLRDGASLLEHLVLGIALDIERRQRAILVELVAQAGKIEPVHQVLDIEGGKAQRHAVNCLQAKAKTRASRPPGHG